MGWQPSALRCTALAHTPGRTQDATSGSQTRRKAFIGAGDKLATVGWRSRASRFFKMGEHAQVGLGVWRSLRGRAVTPSLADTIVRPRLPLFTLREGSEEGRAYLPQRRVPQRVVALVRARVLKKQVQGT